MEANPNAGLFLWTLYPGYCIIALMNDVSAIDIRYLKGVGPKRAGLFNKLGVYFVEDLLYYFPRRYEDRSRISSISRLRIGESQTVRVRILRTYERRSFKQRNLSVFEALVEDTTGRMPCVWFNQPYLRNYLKADTEVVLYGRPAIHGKSFQMQNPEYEIVEDDKTAVNLNYGRIVPVYSLTEELSQRMFRRLIRACLDEYLPRMSEILPYDIRKRNNLLNIVSSILNMHFPQDAASQGRAYKRILFEECFLLQLIFGLKRQKGAQVKGTSHRIEEDLLARFEDSLPFKLTSSQKRVIQEIRADMSLPKPMHRLLQGDVGSGKTVVALYACLIAASNGYQSAFMAPTELLAEQHYQNICSLAPGLRAGLLVSATPKKEKEKVLKDLKNGEIDILAGTHALIQMGVEFKNLSLAVIDEQHKFGVHQRLSMLAKGANPDCLIMTATPIPRTLAMVIYSDLDVSTLDELPAGRLPVKTYLVQEEKRQWAYDFACRSIKEGRQAYIVYPIIEESENLDLKSAVSMYEELSQGVFKEFKVELIHGRLKPRKRSRIMRSFKEGKTDILVSTVVIEVGVDVANSSVMVIEHAERFGLSQLHQLRGRIGRGQYESHCILIGSPDTQEAGLRLKAMVEESDGFRIAQRDLELRGPGEFFGVRQHGLTGLRVNPLEDIEQLHIAKQEAESLLKLDPALELKPNQGLSCALRARFPDYDKLARA